MRLRRLELRGVCTALRAPVVLDFTGLAPGIYAFVGANGSGKSHALEACMPALLFRRWVSYDEPLIAHVPPGIRDAMGVLEFEMHGAQHRVTVQMDPAFSAGKGRTEAIWEVDGVATAGPGLREFDAFRAKWFGSLESLLVGPYAMQRHRNVRPGFFQSSKAERRAIFIEWLGIGRLLELAQASRLRAEGELAELEAVAQQVGELTARRERYDAADTEWRTAAEERVLASSRLAVAADERALAAAATRIAREAWGVAQGVRQAALAGRASMEARVRDLERAVSERAAAVQAASARHDSMVTPAVPQAPARWPATTEVEGELAGVALLVPEWSQLVEELGAQARAARAECAEQAETLAAAERAAAQAERARVAMGGVELGLDLCRRCPLTAEAQRDISGGVSELEIQAARERHLLACNAAGALEAEVEKVRRATQELSRRATELHRELASMVQYAAALERRDASEREQGVARAAVSLARAELAAAERAVPRAFAELGPMPPEPTQEASELAAAERAELEAVAREQALERGLSSWDRLLAVLDERRRTSAVSPEEEEELRHRQRDAEIRRRGALTLARALGPDGVPALEIDAAGPSVSATANALLAEAYGGRFRLEVQTTRPLKSREGTEEVFEVLLLDAEAGGRPHTGSGGEMVPIECALRLALALYGAEQSERPRIETLCLDEPAGALDPDAAQAYLRMVRAARELGGFHHVVLIAHDRSLWESVDGRFEFGGGAVQYVEHAG